jgi:Uma2 family endonuclease
MQLSPPARPPRGKRDVMVMELVEETTQVEIKRRRFTVAELLQLAKLGFLGIDERVELIRGEIVEMSPISEGHASSVMRLTSLLSTAFGRQALVNVQNPVQLDEETLLQPDVALLQPRDDFYSKQHPAAENILLVIEVSDTTLRYDRRVKAALYGAAGVMEYWIINLPKRVIEVYREPQTDGYRTVTRYAPGETLSSLAFSDVVLPVNDILGTRD